MWQPKHMYLILSFSQFSVRQLNQDKRKLGPKRAESGLIITCRVKLPRRRCGQVRSLTGGTGLRTVLPSLQCFSGRLPGKKFASSPPLLFLLGEEPDSDVAIDPTGGGGAPVCRPPAVCSPAWLKHAVPNPRCPQASAVTSSAQQDCQLTESLSQHSQRALSLPNILGHLL